MPDTLSLSTGLSFGLLAGVVSGVCYLVANGIKWPKSDSRPCLQDPEPELVCRECGGDLHGAVLPCVCVNNKPVKFEKGAWFLRQVQKTLTLMPWSISSEKLAQIEEEHEGHGSEGEADRGELRNIRQFLEALSARLSGGTLDQTKVAPMYDHPSYLPSSRGDAVSVTSSGVSSSASSAHAQLKRLVARVVEEAAALPALSRYAAEPSRETSVEASTYEDLLATAILNKVIERYQTESGSGGRSSSGIHSASASPTPSERSTPRSLQANHSHSRDITSSLRDDDDEVSDWEEGDVTDDALEMPRRVPFPEFGGDIIHVKEDVDRDYDEVSGSDIQAVDGSWEENWLFQKKKMKTLQSVPVPMLVPNSNTDYRVLIGDRDADDTTDLSDNASDAEAEDVSVKSDIKRVLDSKHIIGGKPKMDVLDFEPDSLTSLDGVMEFDSLDDSEFIENEKVVDALNKEFCDTVDGVTKFEKKDKILVVGIDSGPLTKAEFAVDEIHRSLTNGKLGISETEQELCNEARNNTHEFANKSNYLGSTNTLNGHEREGEYEEAVDVAVQRYADSLRRHHFEDDQLIPTRDTDQNSEMELIPGSIADRERKKWLNFVDMPNNPYSKEAIQKRLKAKSVSSIFDSLTHKPEDLVQKTNGINGNLENSNISTDTREDLEVNKEEFANEAISSSPKILKQISAEEVPQFKRYGRDYYIKEAKKSSGGRSKSLYSDNSALSSRNKSTSLDSFDTELTLPGLLINQFNNIACNQQFPVFEKNIPNYASITITNGQNGNKDAVSIEYDDVIEETLFSAQPALVNDDTDEKFEEILQAAYANTNSTQESRIKESQPILIDSSFMSTSSNEDSIKIYCVQTGEIMKCTSTPTDKLSAPRYENKVDSNDNLDMPDKNVAGISVDLCVSHQDLNDAVSVDDEQSFENRKLEDIIEIEESLLPKVKELAKKFIKMEPVEEYLVKPSQRRRKKSHDFLTAEADYNKGDKSANKQAYMHSLTARSISKQFREGLKLSMAVPLKTPGGTKDIPDGIEEVTKESTEDPNSPLPEPGTIKSKLAFFEGLKSKFNMK